MKERKRDGRKGGREGRKKGKEQRGIDGERNKDTKDDK